MILAVVELPVTEMRFHEGKLLHSLDEDLWWKPRKYVDQPVHVGAVAHRWRNSTRPRGYASGHDGRSLLNSLPCLSAPSCLLRGNTCAFCSAFACTDHRWGIVLQALMLSTQLLRSAPLVPSLVWQMSILRASYFEATAGCSALLLPGLA